MSMTIAELYAGYDLDSPAIKAPIEPGIAPVCSILNALPNVNTLWSCEGHPDRPALPYVVYIGPQQIAFKAQQLLTRGRRDGALEYVWEQHSTFRNDSSLQYVIKPGDIRLTERSFRWWKWHQWNQRKMNEELLRLANLLAQLKG